MDQNLQFDEAARLESLLRYDILDTDAEQLFDDFTQLAAQICNSPISLISLVDDERQWFKSKVGIGVSQTPREVAFCAHAIGDPAEVMVVQNALEDERFANNPLVTGEPHIRSYAGAPLVTNEGHALGALCVIDRRPRDLTDQQIAALKALARQVVAQLDARINLRLLNKAARDLELERREMELIFDTVPTYLFFKDTKNNIIRLNRAAAETLGHARRDIEGRPTAEFYPNNAEAFFQHDLQVINSKVAAIGYDQLLVADMEGPRWVRTDKIPILDEQGEVERLLVVATDITELKETEDSLRESQAELGKVNANLEELVQQKTSQLAASTSLYEDLYQNAPDLYVSVDPETGCILQCNQTLLHKTGYGLEDIVGKPVFSLYHPSSLDPAKSAMEEFRTTGAVHNRELRIVCKDNSTIDVSLNVSSVRDEHGNIVSSRSVWRDITEKKRLEKESKQNVDQLAHLSRVATMNEMATGIAHELNQPLHAIKNYAEGALIRLGKRSINNTSLVSLFRDIVSDADRAAQLITSFRRFVKPSGKHAVSILPDELVGQLVQLLAREMEQLGSKLSVDLAEGLPHVTCDTIQIEQVLLNLIRNAADATSGSDVADQTIRLVIEPTENQSVRFSVVDYGLGLSEVDVDHMFDAFYTTKETGLGMGLAICRTIVETHGGKLVAKANEETGLTMSFELPIT